ncbi:MAG TPA: AIPR family protein [Candidatus Baltobacteraceae bacterium]|jgi:hypothetical protein|nr:AIPR family protein [Candidatus Baltobacteraceae bacterium]
MKNVTDQDLKNEIADMRERYPRLQDSELFVACFLKCCVTENEQEAIAALVGGPGDKSLDAILIDDPSKTVFVVQGKYRQRTNGAREHRSDVTSFAEIARIFSDTSAFSSFIEGLEASAAGKAENARKRIRSRGYRIQLFYVTTGLCSQSLTQEADRIIRQAESPASIEIIDGKRMLRLLTDYLGGVAPPVPFLELEIENGNGIRLEGVLQRYDGNTRIESLVFPVNVWHIAEMYEKSGIRLFARNVRGFLDQTSINKNMEATLHKEPELFWYYNNGITIICDEAVRQSRAGRNLIRVVNPQVINGQQTTRTLHKKASRNSKATVLVRVISVPRETDEESDRFENLVSKIVAATNWQNAIRASDLMANDRRQIEIERKLRNLDYQYLRKRQSKGEARRHAGVRHRFLLKKEEVAQAVAACDLDPSIVRQGKEGLFEERYYGQVFPNTDPNYYLPRYWLVDCVSSVARGYPERAYAKWVVTHFIWQRLQQLLKTRHLKQVFTRQYERGDFKYLAKTCNAVFRGVMAFYRSRRGTGDKAIDVSTFFQRRGRHQEFERFWRNAQPKHRAQLRTGWDAFKDELQTAADSE